MKQLENYEKASQELTNEFLKKYFLKEGEELDDLSSYWIGDQIGGVLSVNDYYIELRNMIDAIRLDCSVDKFFEWYDSGDTNDIDSEPVNMKLFLSIDK